MKNEEQRMKNNLLSERLTYNGDNGTHTHVHLICYSAEHCDEIVCQDFDKIASLTAPDVSFQNWRID